ncbi:MAG: diguanylate cyclase [Candidatus Zixiibacteriota bacterium]
MFHCALYQKGIDIKDKLKPCFPSRGVVWHEFDDLASLHEFIQSSILDLIFIAGNDRFNSQVSLIRRIKKNSILSLVPLILYHPAPDRKTTIAGLLAGADEFLWGRWDKEIVSAKLKMSLKRSYRDLGMNPTTRLPGMILIQKELERRIKKGEKFAICHADLDDFKAYNDFYGYFYGDKLIRLTSEIVRDIVYSSTKNGFVGHIGGDDFVFLIPSIQVDQICRSIITAFDKIIQTRYKEKDLRKGFIETKNRRGEMERFSIMTLSISVIINKEKMFSHVGELSHMLVDLKKYTKSLPGSNYVVERRKKY